MAQLRLPSGAKMPQHPYQIDGADGILRRSDASRLILQSVKVTME
jgi:hypothetical protein